MPDFAEMLNLDYWREHALVVAYAVAGVLLFIIFTIGTFPYDRALTSALVPLGFKLSYDSEHPAFPIGAILENVQLISLDQPAAPPLVRSEALKLTPGFGTLIGRPTVGIRADLYGGRIWASVQREGDLTGLDFHLTDIDLSRYPVPPQLGTTLKGIVSGGGYLAVMGQTVGSQQGAVTLEGHDLDFALIRGLPTLRFSRLRGSFQIDHATLRVNALEGTGPDMTISGSGVIHLGPTVASSMMEMTMRISPTMAGRTRLGVLFAFLPHPPDNRPYVFHGPLLMPQAS
jgi:type II secretion system protein N